MATVSVSTLVVVVVVVTSFTSSCAASDVTATCVINKESGLLSIEGYVNFTQPASSETVTVNVHITGFNDTNSKHGFHVHASGNLSQKCNAAGGHLNPYNVVHGGPTSTVRHVGDLGNVVTDNNGTVSATITDNVISLVNSTRSFLGKAIVIHSGEDDLGVGNWSDSNTTGHAGVRYGCCVITATTKPTGASSTIQCGVEYVIMTSLLLALKQLTTVGLLY